MIYLGSYVRVTRGRLRGFEGYVVALTQRRPCPDVRGGMLPASAFVVSRGGQEAHWVATDRLELASDR